MPRDTPSPLTALQKIQLASAREKLKIEAARARAVEEELAPKEVKRNQFGHPIVPFEEMPELEPADMDLISIEFERLACPHWAVKKYRPGFGPKNELRKLSRDSWYFYETGRDILKAVADAVLSDRMPTLLEDLSTEGHDVAHAMEGLLKFLELERDAIEEAAVLHRTTVEKLDAKNTAELAEIRKSLDTRWDALSKRCAETG
jgi:hypothetical protein